MFFLKLKFLNFLAYTMILKTVQDLLPHAQCPSRYIGGEINTVRKDPESVSCSFGLAFPDLYEIGTSHFGIQILYSMLNGRPDTGAERFFTPAPDMAELLRKEHTPLFSLENRRPMIDFDIIGFSLLYELNYTNVLMMLDLAGIPFRARDRDESHPFIIAGGPCTCNPLPVADLFDAIVVGEGEAVIHGLTDAFIDWKKSGSGNREALLDRWGEIKGVWIPSRSPGVRRVLVTDLNTSPFPTAPILPYGKPVHDRLRLEIARGCTRGCRFCQAGMIYRPARERSPETLMDLARDSLAATGYTDISLLSLSTGDYRAIAPLMEGLMGRCAEDRVAVSLPSLRAGTLTPGLMHLIQKVRKTGFTIAPEAGSDRLRRVINKNITEADIQKTVSDAIDMGWKVIKLYFMIGLPEETDADLAEMVALVDRLRRFPAAKGRRPQINVSVGTFIPKPHTPFQWAPQISLKESKEKIEWLREKLRLPGVRFKWQQPEVSLIEGLFARGDRRLNALLIRAYSLGCRLDGWSDHFSFYRWTQAMADTGIDMDEFTTRARSDHEPLPWDLVDMGIEKRFLVEEWHRAKAGDQTGDCRDGECNGCGVCDFDTIAPRTFPPEIVSLAVSDQKREGGKEIFQNITAFYSKRGDARFLGHLEMVNIFIRAMRRAGLRLKYSQGFHPLPKISFEDPLPIGLESESEAFYFTLAEPVPAEMIPERLNPHLPEGLCLTGIRAGGRKSRQIPDRTRYTIRLKNGYRFDPEAIGRFRSSAEWVVERIRPNGKIRRVDLAEVLSEIRLEEDQLLLTVLRLEGKAVRPAEVMASLFDLPEEAVISAEVLRLADHV